MATNKTFSNMLNERPVTKTPLKEKSAWEDKPKGFKSLPKSGKKESPWMKVKG
jgi:hypothetical protein